jgi:hypothetical protein
MGNGVAGGKWFFLLTTVSHYLIVEIYILFQQWDYQFPSGNGPFQQIRRQASLWRD